MVPFKLQWCKRLFTFFDFLSSFRPKLPLFWKVVILDLILGLFFSILISSYDERFLEIFLNEESLGEIFLLTVVFGPWFETLITPWLVLHILNVFKLHRDVLLWIATLLFAFMHDYNVVYILISIPGGLLYTSYYMYLKENKKNGFFQVWMLHLLYNLFLFIMEYAVPI